MKDRFAGVWIGESMGPEPTPAVVWRITHVGQHVFVYPRGEAPQSEEGYFSGTVADDDMSFSLYGLPGQHGVANVIDADHFYVSGWDRNDPVSRSPQGFDMVFSRPGLPELCARKVWEAAKAAQQARKENSVAERA